MRPAIALVGMACRYPDAQSPAELWENALSQRRAFRRIPPERLRLEDYYHPDRSAADCTYSTQGAFLTDYEFDRVHFRISGSAYRSSDLAHWLALDIASQALRDAGFTNGDELPRTATGVLVGNTLTGEFSRANSLRLRWPYVSRVVSAALQQEGWSPEQCQTFLLRLERAYKEPFAPVGEETLAGGLSNTIAGRICNYFDLKGGGYTVDGACASSLLAVATACTALANQDIDVALAGGVDLSLDPFELIGFAKSVALTADEMRVYDVHSSGFLPGEGCGFVVLMRYEDAIAQQRHIYGLIRGWGISSDGSGGITRPEVEGQQLALTRAYQRAGFGIHTVAYFEGHGTGTSVGDATELQALTGARQKSSAMCKPVQASISSVKANIGHTKAAAGVAGLIKATMALGQQVLPPTTGMVEPHRELTQEGATIQGLQKGQLWSSKLPLRAGVSAMGFGGINTHLVLEGVSKERRTHLTAREQQLLSSHQDAELLLLRGKDTLDLQRQVDTLLTLAHRLSRAELTDLASYLAQNLQDGPIRAALVVSSPQELTQRLNLLKEHLLDGTTKLVDAQAGIFLGEGNTPPRVGFLFPGQGSPSHVSGGLLRCRFSSVECIYQRANLSPQGDVVHTAIAQPAIVTNSLAALHILKLMNISAQISVGHSLGELTALHWSGAYDGETLQRIAALRGKAMADTSTQTGMMASIIANRHEVERLIETLPVTVAGINSPRQTVISGEMLAVNKVVARAQAKGFKSMRLSVSHAFHSPLVQRAAEVLKSSLEQEQFSPLQHPVLSTVTGHTLPRSQDVKGLLYQQVTHPVRFMDAVIRAQEQVDLFIEVGPGNVLSRLTSDFSLVPAIAIDAGGASLKGLLSAVGAAFVLGTAVHTDMLFSERFSKAFDLNWNPQFLVNPCERAPLPDVIMPQLALASDEAVITQRELPQNSETSSAVELVQRLVAARAELPPETIGLSSRLLSDLHLNSITVGQIIAEACRALELPPSIAPTEYADATIAEVAQALQDLKATGGSVTREESAREMPGLYPWVYPFAVQLVEKARLFAPLAAGEGNWQVFAPTEYRFKQDIQQAFAALPGRGTLVCLPSDLSDEHLSLLLEAAQRTVMEPESTHFVLVQHGKVAGALARTLYLEKKDLTVCILHIPQDHLRTVEWALTETAAAHGYVEVFYDSEGTRREPVLKKLMLPLVSSPLPLTSHDVLLVTGGGKGIAAECALALAQATGVRLALFGRSVPAHDQELAENLNRMSTAHVRYHYLSVDVNDARAVQEAVQEIEVSMGPVTALLHGAGANTPVLLSALSEEALQRTLNPKVRGLKNILAAVTPEHLKLLVTFGSIIARTGMRGEADYALANEWLGHMTEAFQQQYPTCHCLCIEWSVWSGVGMGERLGRIEALKREGIMPISPDKGVELFLRLLATESPSARVVVTGRFGEAPTLAMEASQLPFLRFLEQPVVHYPGTELITQIEVSASSDPYVEDHKVQGERLIPAVVGLEAMAQVAQAVTGCTDLPTFEQVRLERPLIVPREGSRTLRIAALVHESGKVEVALRSEETAFQVDHFHAWCSFVDDVRPAPFEQLLDLRQMPDARVELDPERDLYGSILFHGGRFKRIRAYRHLRATECVAEITPCTEEHWFARYLPSHLILGDPAVRDAVIHAIQACIPQATLLPIAVERIMFNAGRVHNSDVRLLLAKERERHGERFIYDVEVLDEQGELLEQWQGLHLQQVQTIPSQGQWSEVLFGPFFERSIPELVPGVSLQLTLQKDSDLKYADRSRAAVQTLVRPTAQLYKRPDGKPMVMDLETRAVSTAHLDTLTLAVTSSTMIGCDLEKVEERPAKLWRDLLGEERFTLATVLAAEGHENPDVSATRVWAASECLKKVGALLDAPLMLSAINDDGWRTLATGPFVILTYTTHLRMSQQQVVFAFCLDRLNIS